MCGFSGYNNRHITNQDIRDMKPKTKIQKQLVKMAGQLPKLTDVQIRWGMDRFSKKAYFNKDGKIWCQNCGSVYRVTGSMLALSIGVGSDNCQECGCQFDEFIPRDRNRENNEVKQVTYITTYHGWIVARTFMFWRDNTMGEKTVKGYSEVFQNWLREDGKEFITGKSYSRGVGYFHWDYDSEYNIKFHNESYAGYYVMDDVFDIKGNYIYPRVIVTPIIRRNGWNNKLLSLYVNDMELIRRLLIENNTEWLVKIGQYKLLEYLMQRGDYQIPCKYAVRIANKNKYMIEDASLWYDYLELLEYFHLDTHNAHYVCPADLRKEHDRLLDKKDRREKELKIKRSYAEAKFFEADYQKRMKSYIGMQFDDGTVFIHMLESVKEFLEEGTHMHHCVYNMGYYKKEHKNSLIMSARDSEGNRLETIEVNLRTYSIVQSRGHNNQSTDYHDEIIRLVSNYMPSIRLRAHTRKQHKITKVFEEVNV